MNIDVVLEILLHLPISSLLRFRAICKLWCYIIDSPHFIKLHTLLRRNNIKDEEVYLHFTFGFDYRLSRKEVLINLLHNGTSLKSLDFGPMDLRVSGAVKGFDMKNEVFRTITISGDQVLGPSSKFFAILAKGEYSFVILVLNCWRLKVYESSGEGSNLIWNNVNNVILYSLWGFNIWKSDDIPIQRNDDCVVLKGRKSSEVILYDYRARKFIKHFKMRGNSTSGDEIIEYEGSFISP